MEYAGISEKTVRSIADFVKDRDWAKFHNPKDLAISISLEAAELLELFQWSGNDLYAEKSKEQMKDELADVIIYCILMAKSLNVNPDEILKKKIAKNTKKYPVGKSYGISEKYTELGSKL